MQLINVRGPGEVAIQGKAKIFWCLNFGNDMVVEVKLQGLKVAKFLMCSYMYEHELCLCWIDDQTIVMR